MEIKYEYLMSYLNSISRMAVIEEAKECQNLIEDFMNILRYKNNTKNEVTITQEMKVIKKMIDIYKAKNGNQFLFIINENLLDERIYIPKNMMLTFVENALEHAYKHSNVVAELKIIINSENKKCVIIIQDNGIGFDTKNIFDKPKEHQSIINIMHKANEVGNIDIKSDKKIGTKVEITIFRENMA